MQGEKGEIGPEGTPGQMGLPGKNVSKPNTMHTYAWAMHPIQFWTVK